MGLRKDGSRFWGEVRGLFVPFSGRQVRVTGIRDITSRKYAEAELERTVALLKATIESTADGIVVIDPAGNISTFNRKFVEMWGLSDEVLATRQIDHVGPRMIEQIADKESFLTRVEAVREAPTKASHDEVVFKDGRTYEHWALPQRLGEDIVGHVWSFRDISDRRRAEIERDRLLQNEQAGRARAAFVAEVSEMLVARIDYESALKDVARRSVPYLGDWLVVDELRIDGTIHRLRVVHAESAFESQTLELAGWAPDPEGKSGVAAALRAGAPRIWLDDPDVRELGIAGEEHRQIVAELGLRSCLCVPLVARGKTVGAFTFVSAHDPKRYGDLELKLAQDVAHRSAIAIDNSRLMRETQEAVRLRDEFLSIASHELYTPMTSLTLSLQRLVDNGRPGGTQLDAPTTQRLTGMAERQGKRLTKLIGNLLDVARIGEGRLRLDLELVELTAMVREVIASLEHDLTRAGCTVTVEGTTVRGRWDRSRMEQVVTNLLTNAIKFGAERPIEIEVARQGGMARLRVTDHGMGIDPMQRARLFRRFERAVSAEHFGGLGLGLYICKGVVEAHGGSIDVESWPGKGSTFTVEVPCEGAVGKGGESA
jgi:PAS domain S-box-containing protein